MPDIIPVGQSQPCFYHTHEISRIIAYLTDDCFYQVFRRSETFAKNPSSPTAKNQTQGLDSSLLSSQCSHLVGANKRK
ncbi:hypothetical protein NEISUBOT_04551 [Neisseria subflava NJ9703]|uniref:Uncharacterized protein n=1 Tax=Neisseria subflava NJ9703 TaxID=546268 RepID=A0A9W5MYY8_NEISU|nr:hypothetical protein NEISUBOT_04551 [Neisseria subflava NJ9703]